MKSFAIIDIGTNSIRMLIAKTKNGQIIDGRKELIMTRLGQGVDKTKMLSLDAIDRSIKALETFKELASKDGIEDIRAIATSAVRDAINREEFVEKAKKEVGIEIEVISGKREAELGFKGVLFGLDNKNDDILVIDIGGGSTELIIGNNYGVKYKTSLDIGAVRMTDKHIHNDPISNNEYNNIVKDIREIIEETMKEVKSYDIKKIIGIGGTITTLGAIDLSMENYDKNKIHGHMISNRDINKMIEAFKVCTNNERKKIKGLQPKRADIILAGSIILYEILSEIKKDEIIISDYDNLEGYIYERVKCL